MGNLSEQVGNQFKGTKIESPVSSVGMKLFLLVFCGILVCVLSLGWFSYEKSSSIIQKKVAAANEQISVQTAGKLALILSGYERQSLQFITDSTFMSLLNTIAVTEDDYVKFDASRQLADKLSSISMVDGTYESLSLIPAEPEGQFISSGSSLNREEALKSPFLNEVREGNGKAVWIPTMPKGLDGTRQNPTFAVGRMLNQGRPYYLILEIKASALQEQMESVNFGEGSSSFIVSDENVILYGPDEEKWGGQYENRIPGEEQSLTARMNGVETLSTAGIIPVNQWKVIGNMPVSMLVEDAKAISNLTWLMSLIAAAIAVAIGLFVTLTVGQPLVKLRRLMNEGEKGNLTVRSDIRKRDEIGQVSDSFNRMMEDIASHVKQSNLSAQEVLETAATLTDSSRKTAGAAKEIAVATEEIAGGATHLAAESEKDTDLRLIRPDGRKANSRV